MKHLCKAFFTLVTIIGMVLVVSTTASARTLDDGGGSNATSRARAAVDAQPGAAALSADERDAVAATLVGVAADLEKAPKASAPSANDDSVVGTSAKQQVRYDSVYYFGLGWRSFYIHHITDREQRWLMYLGIGGVSAVLCAVGSTPVCLVSGLAAATIINTIQEYYRPDPRLCMELELWYSGWLRNVYFLWC